MKAWTVGTIKMLNTQQMYCVFQKDHLLVLILSSNTQIKHIQGFLPFIAGSLNSTNHYWYHLYMYLSKLPLNLKTTQFLSAHFYSDL
jgi:hypothetical protein